MIPIADAIKVVRKALAPALTTLTGSHNGIPKCYWTVQTPDPTTGQLAPLPVIVFQSQDAGGRDSSMLNLAGWTGDVTIKALAKTQDAADAQLAGVPAVMAALANPTGYTITATFKRPLALPPIDGVWQSGLIYTIELYRS